MGHLHGAAVIREFTDKVVAAEAAVKAKLAEKHPDYADIVKIVIETINPEQDYECPDFDHIHQIDDGDYQGTLVFVIAAVGYQPSAYWYVLVGYGSCSGCDTLKAIRDYTDDPPDAGQINSYWSLALHVAQGLKAMGE